MASVLIIYVIWQHTNVKLPDDDIEMLKHAGVSILHKELVLRYKIVQWLVIIKTMKDAWYMH
jgi:hypothetical protein